MAQTVIWSDESLKDIDSIAEYKSPLVLYRSIEAVQYRGGKEDADGNITGLF